MSYQGTQKHKDNAINALVIAKAKNIALRLKRIEDYNKNPKVCKYCNTPLLYKNKGKTFCNRSCATKYNNKHRKNPYNTEVRGKISKSMKRVHENTNGKRKTRRCGIKMQKIFYNTCKICNKVWITDYKHRRKTCSTNCLTMAKVLNRTYQNGSRKPCWYFNKWENKEVMLESSWEVKVAEKLDYKNIKWIRPDPINWIDQEHKQRLYYPDFYLNDYNIYLDPKNPYCMDRDKIKIDYFKNKINLIVGDINNILNYIEYVL